PSRRGPSSNLVNLRIHTYTSKTHGLTSRPANPAAGRSRPARTNETITRAAGIVKGTAHCAGAMAVHSARGRGAPGLARPSLTRRVGAKGGGPQRAITRG